MDNIRKPLVCGILISLVCLSLSIEQFNSKFNGLGTNDGPLVVSNATRTFVAKVFKDYSKNNSKSMTIEDFFHLLQTLKIGQVYEVPGKPADKVDDDDHKEHKERRVHRRSLPNEDKHEHADNKTDYHNQRFHNNCISRDRLLELHQIKKSKSLTTNDFIQLCPSLVYEVQSGDCRHEDGHVTELEQGNSVTVLVWLYGFASITVISLSSLLAIAIIPCLGKAIYNKVMSFLVALAVGTLAGDAFLHLIPHAFLKGSHEHGKDEVRPLWKGVVIMAGIYVFFMIESFMKARVSSQAQQHDESIEEGCQAPLPTECLVDKDIVNHNHCSPSDCNEAARTESDLKTPSTASIMLTDISQSGDDCDGCVHYNNEGITIIENISTLEPPVYSKDELQEQERCDNESDVGVLIKHPADDYRCNHDDKHDTSQLTPTTTATSGSDVSMDGVLSESEKTVDLHDHHHGDHHHDDHHHGDHHHDDHHHDDHHHDDHHHGHHHHNKNISRDTSIAAVAWMVIVGDGFHNLSDGLAVGAAFSSSVTTGLTTAIAVLCHELPHELGDFAILIKSGISFRQAIAYNMASGIISYVGLVIGIGIGNLDTSHVWVLALTSGLFLYISLVTMLPELKSYQETGGYTVFWSQNAGILTGVIIMLVIAVFEKHN